jgi:transposase-like protein
MSDVPVAVDVQTGEVVTVLSVEQARTLTDQIAFGLGGMWQLVKQAYEGRAWVALDYPSWDEYCDNEFGATYIRLPREDRQEAVNSLRESGLSIRAIAAATGSSVGTVHSDIAGVQNRTPEGPSEPDVAPPAGDSSKTKGLDGKQYEQKRQPADDPEPDPEREMDYRQTAAADSAHTLADRLSRYELVHEKTIRLMEARCKRWRNQ